MTDNPTLRIEQSAVLSGIRRSRVDLAAKEIAESMDRSHQLDHLTRGQDVREAVAQAIYEAAPYYHHDETMADYEANIVSWADAPEWHRNRAFERADVALSRSTGDGWQDISTAPKDGTEVDLYGFVLENSRTPVRIVDCHFHCGEWLHWCTWEDAEGSWARIFKPTHWRYSPAAPTSKGSGDGNL